MVAPRLDTLDWIMGSSLFSFPNPVNEKAARTVAFAVMLMSAIILVSSAYWLLIPLAYGFVARAMTGPSLSPLGRLASSVIAPALGSERPVPGPPKRFAQGIGAIISVAAAVAALGFGDGPLADVLLVMLILAAALESLLGLCLGCHLFRVLMRTGLIPADVCEECADIWARPRQASAGG
jgi:hypothetical protein